ncbi:MAG TPA: hypothetical protein VFR15_12395, partial [Chloroflexia bacterium]|nr:hypothetical protein [Chloroflexia bacterium]
MDRLRYANTARALVAASALAALAFMALVVRPAPAAMANHVPYSRGDVFAAVGYGLIKHFDSSGTLLETLNTSSNSHFGGGMCFDGSGNLFAVNFTDSSISMFNTQGGLLVHPWVANIHLRPESCVFDSTGNMYVGVADGNRQLLKFDPYGNQLAGYSPAVERRGVDWIDLAADQCTMFYTSEGSLVKRFNICTNTQLPDFATGLQLPCYALSIRPNGEVMVACSTRAYRLSSTGTILQEYPRDSFGETGELFSLNLDPDGTSFWVGGPNSIYRIDIATGNLLTSFQSDPFTGLGGLAIFGEFRAAQPTATATVTGTPPTPLPTATRTNTPTPTNTPDPCITGSRYAIATSTATMIPGTDDIGNSCQDCITTIALPFPFQLYGVTYNSANVSTNGNIQFTTTNIDWQNVCLPAASFGPTIFAHWDNLNTVPHANCAGYPGGVCGIFTTVSGSAPNRTFVIEWRTIYQYLGAPPVNFEVLLHEGRSDFDVVYGTVPEIGLSSTEGVQRYFGLDGFTQYACNAAASLTNGLKLTYQYVTCPPTATSTPTRTPVPPTPVPTPPACGYTVLIVHGDPLYPPQTLRNQILALPDMARVDLFDGHNGTPSLD